ncbi:MAG: hypothetical protein ACT4P6_14215 [Gemmatimonadaceae bacterium]
MDILRLFRLVCISAAFAPASADAQRAISRTDYFHHVPSPPSIGSQTEASRKMSLYGDAADVAYRDSLPRDGIEDTRAAKLLAIATRFAPILRRNNFSVPRKFTAIDGWLPYLHVDRWRDGVLTRSDSINLSAQSLTPIGASAVLAPPAPGARDDVALDALLRALTPDRQQSHAHPPGPREHIVLYFDFPGSDEKSWRKEYRKQNPRDAHLYVHFFVDEQPGVVGDARFLFVIQYWMFYPFNDGPNNHEGDWEHINVSVTTRERAATVTDTAQHIALLTESDVARLLQDVTPLDSLIIREVNYFFHHNVFKLEYLRLPQQHDWQRSWISPKRTKPPIWEDGWFIANVLQQRLKLADGRLATHPIGYIGGNNRGIDEFLSVIPRFGASFNRNSHGTYPFPGTWRSIGALGATERMSGNVVPAVRRDISDSDALSPNDVLADATYIGFDAHQLTLVPDWERVIDMLRTEPAVRRDWSFLVLPIRWGFPASVSPAGGAVRHANLGNAAPLGLAFHPGWNRPAEDEEHRPFDPHVLRVLLAPVTPVTGLQNGFGVLNVPIALGQLLPGGNAIFAQVLPWVSGALSIMRAPPARTFYAGKLPTRFTSFGVGAFRQFGGNEFGRFLPRTQDSTVSDFLAEHDSVGAAIDRRSFNRAPNYGSRLWFTVHYGDRFAIENSLSVDTTVLTYRIADRRGQTLGRVRGTMATGQLAGGIRVSTAPIRDVAMLFARGGYSWTWHRVNDAELNGKPLPRAQRVGGHWPGWLPSAKWWPNGSYIGAGAELFTPRSHWIYGRLGYGLRVEVAELVHPMRGTGCGCLSRRRDVSMSLQLGW